MEFSREEDRYTPVETLRSTQNAVMLKVTYSSMASPKLEAPLQVLVVNTHKLDCVYELMKEYALARRCVHKNLVAPHVSFTAAGDDRPGNLWVVMPLVSRVSLRSMMMMSSEFRNGLPEPVVAFVLREILEGLDCIHRVGGGGNVHGNVCAGCIYMDEETTTVKLAFRSLTCEEVTGPWRECKTEPENSLPAYATAADIWSFGLLILELLFGEIPVETHGGLQEFINNDVIIVPKSSRKYVYRMKPLCGRNPAGSGGGGRVSDPLAEIIKECLRKDPKKRPTTQQLLEHDYFKLSKGKGKDVKKVLVRLQKHAVR